MTHLIIGDVHGCVDELRELIDVADPRGERQVALVGDLVAKGPDSRGVVRLARERGALSVRGNHDEKVLAWKEGAPAERPKLAPPHQEVADQLEGEDWAWLLALPYFLELPAVDAIVVHGGLVPGVPLEAQDPQNLISMRSLKPDGSPSKRIEEGVPWGSRWPGPELVVFGHDAVRGLQQHEHAVGLDTGCVYGGALTGLLLPERKLVRVEAKRSYAAKG